ncbi:hypothetical protein D7322_07105 [Sphingobacterium puteale]|uniref:Uncharacterized protein n=1 Tax=Sphingobacterium puteale TaxID=2420510 RepID=A0A420W1Y5_9SPHI|nr:class I SAM-dependent methyltransferase [Sphingobacterium puteale]RKO72554.1 hypothetical protein D7322_07105 [Sphingobacterium puteale]
MKLFRGLSTLLKGIKNVPQFISLFHEQKVTLSRIDTQLGDVADLLKAMQNKLADTDLIVDRTEGGMKDPNWISPMEKKISLAMENYFQQVECLLSIYRALPNLRYLPSTRGWAGSPDFLSKLVEIVLKKKPQFVFELSSGVSSIVLGTGLQANQVGNLLSIDHEEVYANITRDNIRLDGIEQNCKVEVCPLVDIEVEGIIHKWYDLQTTQIKERIDLLVIDGPPGSTQSLARYPAVPLLYSFFSDYTVILMDDANRRDEQVIAERWIKFLHTKNFEVQRTDFPNFEKGLVMFEVRRIV